jgi:FMN phosphatase YigB (HAD superfamily)
MTAAVVVDMDGTLCDVSSIRHYVAERRQRNFDKFHRASLWCPPMWNVRAMVRAYHRAGDAILVVTARDARYEQVTRDWLVKYSVPFHRLYMRPWGDIRPDVEVKTDILAALRADGFVPRLAIDDNPAVIGLWEREGIPTHTVPGFT